MGNHLKKLRLRAGVSVSEVAKRIGVAASTYREWEYGRSIKGEPYVELARVLGVTLTELMIGERPSADRFLKELDELGEKVKTLKNNLTSLL